jgi:hypothetical protein
MQLLAEARLLNNDYDAARELSFKAIALGTKSRENANIARSYYVLGRSYLDSKSGGRLGSDYLRTAYEMADFMGLQPLMSACTEALSQARAA